METAKDPAPCSVIEQEEICSGDELAFSKITYLDNHGLKRYWEGVTRKCRAGDKSTSCSSLTNGSVLDEVYVIAFHTRLLHRQCIILVKRYRPAVNNYTIEMPTGKVKGCESAEEAALRILNEITGYHGTIKRAGPILAVSPTATDRTMRFLTILVDGDESYNRNIRQKSMLKGISPTDPSSETLLIPVEELLEKLREFTEANFLVDSRIDAFAIGLVMGNSTSKRKVHITTREFK